MAFCPVVKPYNLTISGNTCQSNDFTGMLKVHPHFFSLISLSLTYTDECDATVGTVRLAQHQRGDTSD